MNVVRAGPASDSMSSAMSRPPAAGGAVCWPGKRSLKARCRAGNVRAPLLVVADPLGAAARPFAAARWGCAVTDRGSGLLGAADLGAAGAVRLADLAGGNGPS